MLPDLQMLTEAIPEIASKIELPDLKNVLEFFTMRYGSKDDVKVLANKLLDIRAIKE